MVTATSLQVFDLRIKEIADFWPICTRRSHGESLALEGRGWGSKQSMWKLYTSIEVVNAKD